MKIKGKGIISVLFFAVALSCSHTFEDRTGTVKDKQYVPATSGLAYGVSFNGKFGAVAYSTKEKYIVFILDENDIKPHEVSKSEFFNFEKGDTVHYKREKK